MKLNLRGLIQHNRTNPSWLLPALLFALWTLDSLLSIPLTGFRTLDWAVISSIVVKLLVVGLNIFFAERLLIREDASWYKRAKTYTGYFIVFVYVFYNLPRMSWEMDGILTEVAYRRLWIHSFVSTLFPMALYLVLWLKPVQQKWGVYVPRKVQKEERREEKRRKVKRPLGTVIWENVDAVIQSIIIVIILQHFIFQLYVIPTESMVPTYLIQDRTLVTKYQSGPQVPLTRWKLPVLDRPNRGDIVVFQSPEYTHKTLARRVFQQFVYYITLTMVDIDTDANGNPRKRFIVKRLIGEPGEQLMMVDDQVYVRRAGEEFHPLAADDAWSNVDLYRQPPEIRDRIAYLPISAADREMLDRWDAVRADSDLALLADELETKAEILIRRLEGFTDADRRFLEEEIIGPMLKEGQSTRDLIREIEIRLESLDLAPFQYTDSYRYDILLLLDLLDRGPASYRDYSSGAVLSARSGADDLFEEGSKKLNLIFKLQQTDRLLLFSDFVSSRTDASRFSGNADLDRLSRSSDELFRYLNEFYDNRNFPVTPEGKDEFIPRGSYFLMGDNRYNSLDFRHSHSGRKLRALDADDPLSITYFSLLHPYLLTEKNILGKAVATFWPPDRIGRNR